jgi:hypothetical protein
LQIVTDLTDFADANVSQKKGRDQCRALFIFLSAMNYSKLLHAARLYTLIFWLANCQRTHGQIPNQPAITTTTPIERTWPGFGLASDKQEDSMKAVFVHKRQLTHAFGNFYKTPTGTWVLVHYRFGIPEGEQHIFDTTPCPALDSVTFKEHDNYWQDRNGAYYGAIANFSPHVTVVSQADLATFRVLGFEHLAIDKSHVFQLGRILSGLLPSTLKVYTPGGQLTEDWDFNSSAYLLSDNVIYNPEGERLTTKQAVRFRLPPGYKLAYPMRSQPTKKSK